jgi:peptide/nickel transport system ATP-binding protein
MYLGRIVELAAVDAIFETPAHPYTRALLSAIPVPDPAVERRRRRILLPGDVPGPVDGGPAAGCRFRSRCPLRPTLDAVAQARCAEIDPQLRRLDSEHEVACHHAGKELP